MLVKVIAVGAIVAAIVSLPNLNHYQQKAIQVSFCNLPESQPITGIGKIITLNQGVRNTKFTIQDKTGCITSVQIRTDKVMTHLEVANTYQITGKATQGIITNVTNITPFNQADSSKDMAITMSGIREDTFIKRSEDKFDIPVKTTDGRKYAVTVTSDQRWTLLSKAPNTVWKIVVVKNGEENTLKSL